MEVGIAEPILLRNQPLEGDDARDRTEKMLIR